MSNDSTQPREPRMKGLEHLDLDEQVSIRMSAIVLNTVAFAQRIQASGIDVTQPTNPGFVREIRTYEPAGLKYFTDTDTAPGRTAEQDAEDPAYNFAENPEHIAMTPADEVAAHFAKLMQEHHERLGLDDFVGEQRAADQYGGAQMAMDVLAMDYITAEVHKVLPDMVCVFEESTNADWQSLVNLVDGDRILLVDPIDGSTPYSISNSGWCVVVVLCEEFKGSIRVRKAWVGCPDHSLYILDLATETAQRRSFLPRVELDPMTGELTSRVEVIETDLTDPDRPMPISDHWTIHTVALSASQRDRVAGLFRTMGWGAPPIPKGGGNDTQDPGLRVSIFGGNPALMKMATGGVRYFVQSDWCTVYDAIGILFLAVQRGRFEYWRLDQDQPVKVDEDAVIELFHDVHRPIKSGSKENGRGSFRPIPPMFIREAGGGADGDLIHPYDNQPTPSPGETVTDRILDSISWTRKHEHHIVAQRVGSRPR